MRTFLPTWTHGGWVEPAPTAKRGSRRPQKKDAVGALRRHGGQSFFRDEWGILDDHDRQIGTIVEDSMLFAMLRRFATSLIPQTFNADIEGQPVAFYCTQCGAALNEIAT